MTKPTPSPTSFTPDKKIGEARTQKSKAERGLKQFYSDNKESLIWAGLASTGLGIATAFGVPVAALAPSFVNVLVATASSAIIGFVVPKLIHRAYVGKYFKVFTGLSSTASLVSIAFGIAVAAGASIALPPLGIAVVTFSLALAAGTLSTVASTMAAKHRIQYRHLIDGLIVQQNEVFDTLDKTQQSVLKKGIYQKSQAKALAKKINKASGLSINSSGVAASASLRFDKVANELNEKASNSLGVFGGALSVISTAAVGFSNLWMHRDNKQKLISASQHLWETYSKKDQDRYKKINDLVDNLPLDLTVGRKKKNNLIAFYIKKTLFESAMRNDKLDTKDFRIDLLTFVKQITKEPKPNTINETQVDDAYNGGAILQEEPEQPFYQKLFSPNKTKYQIDHQKLETLDKEQTSFLESLQTLQTHLNKSILENLDAENLCAGATKSSETITNEIKTSLEIQDGTNNKEAFIVYLRDAVLRSHLAVRGLFDGTAADDFTKTIVEEKVKEYLEYKERHKGETIPSKARLQEQFPATFTAVRDNIFSKKSESLDYELEENNMHYFYPKIRNEITKSVIESSIERVAKVVVDSKGNALGIKSDKINAGQGILNTHLGKHKAENKPPLFKGIGISFKKMDDGFLIDGVFSPDKPRFKNKKGTKEMSKEEQTALLGRKITHIKQKGVEHNFEALKNLKMDALRDFFSNVEDITLTIDGEEITCSRSDKGYFVTDAASNTKEGLNVVCEKYDPEKHGVDVIDGFRENIAESLSISEETKSILEAPSERLNGSVGEYYYKPLLETAKTAQTAQTAKNKVEYAELLHQYLEAETNGETTYSSDDTSTEEPETPASPTSSSTYSSTYSSSSAAPSPPSTSASYSPATPPSPPSTSTPYQPATPTSPPTSSTPTYPPATPPPSTSPKSAKAPYSTTALPTQPHTPDH